MRRNCLSYTYGLYTEKGVGAVYSRTGGDDTLKKPKDKLRRRRGEGYVDVVVLVLCAMLVLVLAIWVLPVLIAKQQLDTFTTELVREAEISGRVGLEASWRTVVLRGKTDLDPDITWSAGGRIQLNNEVTVLLTFQTNIGLFGDFGLFPITLRAQTTGESEVYWK